MPLEPPLPPDVRAWVGSQADGAELARAWALAALADEPAPDADAAWARLDARLDAAVRPGLRAWQQRGRPGVRPEPAAPVRSFLLRRSTAWGAALAVVVAVVAVGVALWPRTTTVAAGTDVLVTALPDGSEVTLAPGSALRYRRGLSGDTRRVRLDGQGYFDVETAGRPFVVETFNAEVEVLGTEFDVQAWPGAPETAVALVEGRVALRANGGEVTLAPGQVSRVYGAGAPTPPVASDVEAVAAWRRGGFSVVDAPLAAVAAAVEARFGRPVRVGPGVDGDRRLTLFLPTAETADAVLGDVAAYLDLRLQAGPDRYQLLPR